MICPNCQADFIPIKCAGIIECPKCFYPVSGKKEEEKLPIQTVEKAAAVKTRKRHEGLSQKEIERTIEAIKQAGTMKEAAASLGINPCTLYYRATHIPEIQKAVEEHGPYARKKKSVLLDAPDDLLASKITKPPKKNTVQEPNGIYIVIELRGLGGLGDLLKGVRVV